ncbi:hypothetical protein QBC35DRAFT_460773 [Podospora australis]|uniref:Uncharacterized protein n=1 Tax=Podospora australis TaxID=1536484 RepID=A0AAN7AMF3_9PEZI|nr:hypothetical protein QBC35DRAFT_460773 [Podospora australis]
MIPQACAWSCQNAQNESLDNPSNGGACETFVIYWVDCRDCIYEYSEDPQTEFALLNQNTFQAHRPPHPQQQPKQPTTHHPKIPPQVTAATRTPVIGGAAVGSVASVILVVLGYLLLRRHRIRQKYKQRKTSGSASSDDNSANGEDGKNGWEKPELDSTPRRIDEIDGTARAELDSIRPTVELDDGKVIKPELDDGGVPLYYAELDSMPVTPSAPAFVLGKDGHDGKVSPLEEEEEDMKNKCPLSPKVKERGMG